MKVIISTRQGAMMISLPAFSIPRPFERRYLERFRKRFRIARKLDDLEVAIIAPRAPARVKKMLKASPELAACKDGYGCRALHWACHPHLGSELEVVRRLLQHFPEAVREGDLKGHTPIHTVFARRGFGASPRKVQTYLKMKRKHIPSDGVVYTADNDTTCPVLEALVAVDPSALGIKNDNGNCPIGSLWLQYEKSLFGKKEIGSVLANKQSFLESITDDYTCHRRFGGMTVVWKAMSIMVRALYSCFDKEVENDESTPMFHACIGIGDYCPRSFLEFVLELDPKQAWLLDNRGNLPLHVAAKCNQFDTLDGKAVIIEELVGLHMDGPSTPNNDGRLPLAVGVVHGTLCGPWIEKLFTGLEDHQDPATRLYPFMLSASCDSKSSLDMTYQLLRASPSLAGPV